MKKLGLFAIIVALMVSCGDDDDIGLGGISVPPRLLSEVAPENNEEIVEFLETHFYNYEEFDAPAADFDFKIRIDTIAGENATKTPLIQQVESFTVNVSSEQFNLGDDEKDVPHTLYVLEVREGEGNFPTIADSTLLRYEGSLLDKTRFDARSDFFWIELPRFIRGFANGAARLKSGTPEGLIINDDGTAQFSNSGIGVFFIPSGLAYFNAPTTPAIGAYDPLIFSVEVGLFVEDTDTDNDGVPNILEDVNNNGFLFDDNTDNDIEIDLGLRLGIADFEDLDDDGDGVLTRTEISDAEGNIIFPYPDSNGDGTPDYLDIDILRDPNE